MSYFKAKMHKFDFGWGYAQTPLEELDHSAPLDPLTGFKVSYF